MYHFRAIIMSLLFFLFVASTNAFLPQNMFVTKTNHAAAKVQLQAVTTAIEVAPLQSDKRAEAFTAYMTKSHEEKLKAIKVVEDSRNTEIKVGWDFVWGVPLGDALTLVVSPSWNHSLLNVLLFTDHIL